MELQDILQQRVEIARQTNTPTNCYGTALFLAGLEEKDFHQDDSENMHRILNFFKPDHVERGDICIWHYDTIDRDDFCHMAVVAETSPLKLYSRNGSFYNSFPFYRNKPLEEYYFEVLNEIYRLNRKISVRFFRPEIRA